MNWNPLTDDMRRFILMNIPSVPYLEALLLMQGDVNHQWSKEELANRLFISDSQANDLLAKLHESAMIKIVHYAPNLYRFQPDSEAMKRMVDQLAIVYTKNLVEVTNLIHSNIEKKAQKFADAFIWRKGK